MKNVLKKLKIKVYSHYLGTANIQSEKFYILKIYMAMEHPDENFLDEIKTNNESPKYQNLFILNPSMFKECRNDCVC